MKGFLSFSIVTLTCCASVTASDTANSAYTIIEKHLKIIEDYVYEKNLDSTVRRAGAIWFLEGLSGIQSESDGDNASKKRPTIKDYKNWNYWYLSNKEYLSYDDKKRVIVLYKPIAPLLEGFFQNHDTTNRAWRVINGQLKIIGDYVYWRSADNTVRTGGAVHFLNMLTGIQSESDGNFVGQLSPTIKDYINWNRWFIGNRNYLFADEKTKTIVLRREIILPSEN